jgi:hypothetical protein
MHHQPLPIWCKGGGCIWGIWLAMAQNQHDSIYWVHLPLQTIMNSYCRWSRVGGLVKVGSGERERMMLLPWAANNHVCKNTLLRCTAVHAHPSLFHWEEGTQRKTVIDGCLCVQLTASVYVCMGGTHIISVLYWGFDVLHKDSLWIIWRWGHNCEPQVTMPTWQLAYLLRVNCIPYGLSGLKLTPYMPAVTVAT